MFGEKLEFLQDSSFKHTWRFDLSSSWTNGKWKMENDTIYLSPLLIMDTLTIRNSENQYMKDSLVLSNDETSDRIEIVEYVRSLISGGGQYRRQPPKELFKKNRKLFTLLDNGMRDNTKYESIMSRKKYKSYFKPIIK
jgi:hypothetical protein